MTIATITSRVVAQGNGATTAFSYSFLIPSVDDVVITHTDASGNATELTTSQYSVSGLGNVAGGTVTYPVSGSPMATGESLAIQRVLPLKQLTKLTNQGSYFPAVVESAMDTLEMQIQQLDDVLGRAIQLPVSDPTSIGGMLPSIAQRAGMLVSFDENGNIVVVAAAAQSATALSIQLASSAGSAGIGVLQAGAGAILRTLQDKSRERVTVADFGAVGDNVTDDGPAIRLALASGAKTVYMDQPAVAYLIATGSITAGDGQRLVGCGDSTCLVNVTANTGDNTSANALFKCVGSGSIDGLSINYPNQCAADLVADIISYPPTFLFNGSHVGSVKNVRVKGAYDLFRQDASDFANLTLQNIYAEILHNAFSFVGHMGDVSTADNVQVIIRNSTLGEFNGGPVDLWCRLNSTGRQFATTGSNRIDCFRFSNCGIVGGAVANTASGQVWVVMDNWLADISSQSFTGTWSQLILGTGNANQMDAFYSAPHTPIMSINNSKVTITGTTVSLLATGSSAPIVGDNNDITLNGVRFFTSRGYFTPVISGANLKLKASGCSTMTSNGYAPLAFSDISSNDLSGVTIDGKDAFGSSGTPLSLSNFNMAAWSAGVPTNWTTNLGTPANFIRQIAAGATAGVEIFPSPASTGSFYLDYALATSTSHLFGHFMLTATATLVDAAGTAVIGTFEWSIGNATDGFNYGAPMLGDGGSGAECSGLPLGGVTIGTLLAVPPNPTDALSIRLVCNYPGSTNQIKVQLSNLALTPVKALTNPSAENASGTEFVRQGVGAAQARDVIVGGVRQMRRLTSPVTTVPAISGDRVIRNPQAIGSPKAWVPSTLGATPVWTSEGNL